MSPYLQFFEFREEPFRITPDPAFLFFSKHHREALAHLLYGLTRRCGFIALTGEIGSGKTTVLRALFTRLDCDANRIAYIFNPTLTPHEMLHVICQEFALDHQGESRAVLFERLNRFLLDENGAGRSVVLVIDEAQNLDIETLEEIRLLSNLETDKEKLIQIVLAGQPELGAILNRPELVQLNQRIPVRFHLEPLDFEDTCAYIRHRLQLAGRAKSGLFTSPALKKIYDFSGGLPRLINLVCDRAFLVAYTREAAIIDDEIIHEAVQELKGVFLARPSMCRWLPVICLAAVLSFGIGMLVGRGSPKWMTERGKENSPAIGHQSPSRAPAAAVPETLPESSSREGGAR